jgi:hypothetical protein
LDGCFTSYNTAMARTALKMDRYMNQGAGTPKAPPQPKGPVDPELAGGYSKPVVPPAAASHPLFAPRSDSPFADKLKQALQPAGPKQES